MLITPNYSREGDSRTVEKCMQALMAKSSKLSISVEMLAKSMVANALDKSKETKVELLDHSECIKIGNAAVPT